jgi:hypothetical protein
VFLQALVYNHHPTRKKAAQCLLKINMRKQDPLTGSYWSNGKHRSPASVAGWLVG